MGALSSAAILRACLSWTPERASYALEICLNLRNRLIWIAVLTVAFATVQLVASRRKGQRELVAFVTDKLMPVANECVHQAQARAPDLRGALSLQVRLVPDGKLDAAVERVEVAQTSELQEPGLAECVRERTKALRLKLPLPGGPEQLALTFPTE